MNSVNTAFVIGQASDPAHDAPFAAAVRDAIEVGVVVPSRLRGNLESAGFAVVDDEARLSDYGFKSTQVLKRVVVMDGELIVAMGASSDPADALLHAALGWFREHPLPDADVPDGLMTVEGK